MTQRNVFRNLARACAGRARVPRLLPALALVLLGAAAAAAVVAAEPLRLLAQPPPWDDDGAPAPTLEPLARLLGAALGREVRAVASTDALSHWHGLRAPAGHQLAFEEPQFTGFRVQRYGFHALAQTAEPARFAIAVSPGRLVTEPRDLAGLAVAVAPPPSLAALRLLQLYPEPARMPRIVALRSRALALDRLRTGRVAAVVLPDDDGALGGASIALVTDASPGWGLSVSDALDAGARRTLLQAVLTAHHTPQGRRALAAARVRAFIPATDAAFEASARLLRGTWGYR